MKLAFILAIAALASACGAPEAPQSSAPENPTTPPSAVAPAPPQMVLEPLAEADLAGKLSGELGCSFSSDGAMLVLAKGDVSKTARSEAVIKRNGVAAVLPATATGGYDAMVETASFATGDVAIDIRPKSRQETGNEQVSYDATLTLRAEGSDQTFEGQWTCGP